MLNPSERHKLYADELVKCLKSSGLTLADVDEAQNPHCYDTVLKQKLLDLRIVAARRAGIGQPKENIAERSALAGTVIGF